VVQIPPPVLAVADRSFEAALNNRVGIHRNIDAAILRRYKRREWAEVLRGPPPFTAEELAVVQARRQFSWRLVGVTSSGAVMYEVTNVSDRHLPFLSIGIRGKVGNLQGGVWLTVGHIAPGQTAAVAKDTYPRPARPGRC
jgi:hypothetical protein